MESVPAILCHEVFDTVDKLGRIAVPLGMEKEF